MLVKNTEFKGMPHSYIPNPSEVFYNDEHQTLSTCGASVLFQLKI